MNPDIYDFLLSVIKPTAIGAGGAGVGWWFSRRLQNARVKQTELQNVEDAVKIWREMAESLAAIREKQEQELNKNQAKIDLLTTEVANLKAQITSLERENIQLKTDLAKLKKG